MVRDLRGDPHIQLTPRGRLRLVRRDSETGANGCSDGEAKAWSRIERAFQHGDGHGVLPPLRDVLLRQQVVTDDLERSQARVAPWVFNNGGEPIRDFKTAWRSARKAAGLPDRLFHDFRRTAVRNLERAGVSRSVAMKLTGHKTEAVYRRYAIVSDADLREGVEKLAGCFRHPVLLRGLGMATDPNSQYVDDRICW